MRASAVVEEESIRFDLEKPILHFDFLNFDGTVPSPSAGVPVSDQLAGIVVSDLTVGNKFAHPQQLTFVSRFRPKRVRRCRRRAPAPVFTGQSLTIRYTRNRADEDHQRCIEVSLLQIRNTAAFLAGKGPEKPLLRGPER